MPDAWNSFLGLFIVPHQLYNPDSGTDADLARAIRNSLSDMGGRPLPVSGGAVAPKPEKPDEQPKPYSEEQPPCPVCLTYRPTHVALPCGHALGCDACINQLLEKKVNGTCLLCRKEVEQIQRVWI